MDTTTLEGETDRCPSRGPWSTPLRFMDAVRPGFPLRRVIKSGAGSDGRFPVVSRDVVFLGEPLAGKLLFAMFTTAAKVVRQGHGC